MSIREIQRSALVRFSAEQMFALVADFERYPEFLPWVEATRVHEHGESELVGSIEMRRSGLSEKFTTRNTLERPHSVRMQLVDGPFRSLEGRWTFTPIDDLGTQVDLSMRFEFANPVSGWLFGRAFEQSCTSLVDAFIDRAQRIYGPA